ncbi:hypothetical protein V1460_18460 [Streptomyces sp. SCSIO 30461]|uniref:hypothetical protein n=1 Tax=Streptomyces sp. SCSIO 30461 TaxID=3118085 RepID=UPI0030CD0EA4
MRDAEAQAGAPGTPYHWLTDTVGAALLGAGAAIGTAVVFDLVGERGRRQSPSAETLKEAR